MLPETGNNGGKNTECTFKRSEKGRKTSFILNFLTFQTNSNITENTLKTKLFTAIVMTRE